MYNLEDYERLKHEQVEVSKKKWISKKPAMVLGVFVVTVIIFISALASLLGDLNNSLLKYKGYLAYLFEDYDVSTIITDPIYNSHFNSFRDKANFAGFNVINNDKIDLERDDLKLDQLVRFSDNEYGAFLSKGINSSAGDFTDIITVRQFTVAKNEEGLVNIKTVYMFDLSSIESMLGLTLGEVPSDFYVTVDTTIAGPLVFNKYKINSLNEEKSADVMKLLNELFTTNSEVSFGDNLANLVFNVNATISTKTGAKFNYDNDIIELAP